MYKSRNSGKSHFRIPQGVFSCFQNPDIVMIGPAFILIVEGLVLNVDLAIICFSSPDSC